MKYFIINYLLATYGWIPLLWLLTARPVEFIFAWYDLWVGIFVDRAKGKIYIFPLPMFGVVLNFKKSKPKREMPCGDSKCQNEKCTPDFCYFGHKPLALLMLWLCLGCAGQPTKIDTETTSYRKYYFDADVLYVVEIEGCEYIYRYNASIIHKANCKNPEHQKPCN